MRLTKIVLTFLASVFSTTAFAGLITFGNYSLDEDTNIVTDTSRQIEWLQWDMTKGLSIEQALDEFGSAGWKLSSNVQMASLYSDFGLMSSSIEDKFILNTLDYNADDGDKTVYDQLIKLFGATEIAEGGEFGIGDDALRETLVLYGSDLDNDGLYRASIINSDFTRLYNSGLGKIRYQAGLVQDVYSTNFIRPSGGMGVALVRANSVNAPATIGLMTLVIVGLAFRRIK